MGNVRHSALVAWRLNIVDCWGVIAKVVIPPNQTSQITDRQSSMGNVRHSALVAWRLNIVDCWGVIAKVVIPPNQTSQITIDNYQWEMSGIAPSSRGD